MLNIIVGVVFLIGGLSGRLTFFFMKSPDLLAAVGAVMIAWGISQVRRNRQREIETRPSANPEFTPPDDDTF